MEKRTGEAYAFFNCSASKEKIERELPRVREASRCPSELELSLKEVNKLDGDRNTDPKLMEFLRTNEIYSTYPSKHRGLMAKAKPTRMRDLKYAVRARYPNKTNEETAQVLGDVMNEVYLNFDEGEIFTGAIVGKVDGEYGLWKND